jgi:hypothetical protein
VTDAYEPAPGDHSVGRSPLDVGTRVRTGDPIPRPGSWEVVDHDCPAAGDLRALGPPDEAPACPDCDRPVTWQLTHLSATVAADHADDAPLP